MRHLASRAALIGILSGSVCMSQDSDLGSILFEVGTNELRQPCQVHLWDEDQAPVSTDDYPFWYDHFVCDGRARIELPPGAYRYRIARGPEYRATGGQLVVHSGQERRVKTALESISSLRRRSWYSADLHIHRPVKDAQLLMRAADLDIGPVITWWNHRNEWASQSTPTPTWQEFDGHRFISATAGEDEREGGALLYFGMAEPIDITSAQREFPSPMQYVEQAREQTPEVWIDIEKPFWWDVPIWLACGQFNSIGIANNHMCRDQMLANEAWGKPRDEQQFPGVRGNGYWTQEIYYHILNCGFRLPPSAGSASGVLPNPVGYNRLYVHVPERPLTPEAWWRRFAEGRCFVTNGPLLICRANGRLPGSTFQMDSDNDVHEKFRVELSVELTSADRIRELEVIHNGNVAKSVPLRNVEHQTVEVSFDCDKVGWFLVRAITDNDKTFRFASTGPYYVESDTRQRIIDVTSVQFFQDWVARRMERASRNLTSQQERDDVLRYHQQARAFWQQQRNVASQ